MNEKKKRLIIVVSSFILVLGLSIGTYFFTSPKLNNNKNYNAILYKEISLNVGEKFNLDSYIDNRDVNYEIKDENIINEDENGNFIALKGGTTEIILHYRNSINKTTLKVRIASSKLDKIQSEDLEITQSTTDEKVYEGKIKDLSKSSYSFEVIAEDESATITDFSNPTNSRKGQISITGEKSETEDKEYSIKISNTINNKEESNEYKVIVKKAETTNETATEIQATTETPKTTQEQPTTQSENSLKCPVIAAMSNDKTLEAGKWTNKDIIFTFDFNNTNAVKYDLYVKTNDGEFVKQATNTIDKATNKSSKTIKEQGRRKLKLVLYDKDGKTTECLNNNKEYLIDRTAPKVPSVSLSEWKSNYNSEEKPTKDNKEGKLKKYNSGKWAKNNVYTEPYGGNDELSGFDHYEYTTSGTMGEVTSQSSYRNIDKDGESTIKWRACDKAGNCSNYTKESKIYINKNEKLNCPKITAYSVSNDKKLEANTWTNDVTFVVDFAGTNASSYALLTAKKQNNSKYTWRLFKTDQAIKENEDQEASKELIDKNNNYIENIDDYKDSVTDEYKRTQFIKAKKYTLKISGTRKFNIRLFNDNNNSYLDCGNKDANNNDIEYKLDNEAPTCNPTKTSQKNGQITIDPKCTDTGGSGIQKYTVKVVEGSALDSSNKTIEKGKWIAINGNVKVKTSENTKLQFSAKDNAGNKAEAKPVVINPKTSEALKCPTIIAKVENKIIKPKTWTNKNITFTFNFSGSSATKYKWYTTDSKGKFIEWKTITNLNQTRTITGEGKRKIELIVYDKNNKKITCKNDNKEYWIDKTGPSTPKLYGRKSNNKGKYIDLGNNQSYKHKVYIEKITSSDKGSLLKLYQYRNCNSNVNYDVNTSWGKFTVNQKNGFCRQFRAQDKAGNYSSWSKKYYAYVAKPKVVVFAGHGYSPYCQKAKSSNGSTDCRLPVTYKGQKYTEPTLNRDYAKKLIAELKKLDINVDYGNKLLGETNANNSRSLWAEIKTANSNRYKKLQNQFKNYDYAIELHMNAKGGQSAGGAIKGVNILYNHASGATKIDKAVKKATENIMGNSSKEVNTVNWEDQTFFRKINVPFTYLESEFYDNENALLKFKANEDKIAKAVAQAIKTNLW